MAAVEVGLSQREAGHMPFTLVCVDLGQRKSWWGSPDQGRSAVSSGKPGGSPP